jgi:hypothetical protein
VDKTTKIQLYISEMTIQVILFICTLHSCYCYAKKILFPCNVYSDCIEYPTSVMTGLCPILNKNMQAQWILPCPTSGKALCPCSLRDSRDEADEGAANQEEETAAILDGCGRLTCANCECWKR